MHLLLSDVLVLFVSVQLCRSCGVRRMDSRYLASGATRDGGQQWAGVGWELSQEGEELSSEHLHYTSAPLGVSAGGISLPEQSGSRIDDCPKGGMEKSHHIPLRPPISTCLVWDFCLLCHLLFLPLSCCPLLQLYWSLSVLAGVVSRDLRKESDQLGQEQLQRKEMK